ncbi:Transient receptor putative cation channel sub V member 5 [Chytriomyces hyalinus]|nr:Transient receptor putative cation channel sub V member 5 [Chytriomyces hyalinus]
MPKLQPLDELGQYSEPSIHELDPAEQCPMPPIALPQVNDQLDRSRHPSGEANKPNKAGPKHGLANQNADFFQQPICQAIAMGDVQTVDRLLDDPKNGNLATIRGSLGETILHVACLFKQENISLRIIERCGHHRIQIMQAMGEPVLVPLVNVQYGVGLNQDGKPYGTRFYGETALHLACRNGMLKVAEELLTQNAIVNAEAMGDEFIIPLGYTQLYSGCTPLQFAVTQTKNLELVQLLVRNGANLYYKDPYGNNVLHIMAYYGRFNEIYKFLQECNHRDLMNQRRNAIILSSDRNNVGLTPAQFGIKLGHAVMLDAMKETLWTLGEEIVQYQVAIDNICPVLNKRSGLSSPSVLEIVVDLWSHNMIRHPILKSLVQVKWNLYGRKYFLAKFIWSVITLSLFTLSITIDKKGYNNQEILAVNTQFYLIACACAFSLYGIFEIVRSYWRLYRRSTFPPHLKGQPFMLVYREYAEFVWYGINDSISENFLQLCFCVCVIVTFGFRLSNILIDDYDISYLPSVEGFGALLGFVHIANYGRGLKNLGPLILVIVQIIFKGLARWLAIYGVLAFGYSIAFYAQMKNFDYDGQISAGKMSYDVDRDWNNVPGAFFWTVRFLWGLFDVDNMRNHAEKIKNPGFMLFLFISHEFILVTLFVNVFIALLVDIWNNVSQNYESQWLLQMAKMIIDTDHSLTQTDRQMVMTFFGYHQNPVTLKKNKRQKTRFRIHPAGMKPSSLLSVCSSFGGASLHPAEELRGSITSLASVDELAFRKLTARKHGEEEPTVDPRRFFMFLDYTYENGETETRKLVGGIIKGEDVVEDVEIILGDNYWSLAGLVRDLGRLAFPKPENFWTGVGKNQ